MSTYRSSKKIPGWGDWLKRQITSAGMSQPAFAKAVGVSKSTVWRWVHDDQPKADYIDAIAEALFLQYDSVAIKAGIRPIIRDIDPASREAAVLGLVERIDWEADNVAITAAVDLLQSLAREIPKRDTDE